MLLGNGYRGIRALTIDHDDFIHQSTHGLQTIMQVVRLIASDDDG
jgi:hypothetical protein